MDGRISTVYETANGMTFEKVSHPDKGLKAADGVVDYIGDGRIAADGGGQGDRGQSYSYAAESDGDWVYIGTMYGGLGVQAILKGSLTANVGMSVEEATALIQTLYSGNMYLGEPDGKSAGGTLFKFNVKTGETKILMSQSEGIDVWPLWWAVSIGACFGGNGTIIGASANVVLTGIAGRRGYPITFIQFLKIGAPMMIMSIILATGYLLILFGNYWG